MTNKINATDISLYITSDQNTFQGINSPTNAATLSLKSTLDLYKSNNDYYVISGFKSVDIQGAYYIDMDGKNKVLRTNSKLKYRSGNTIQIELDFIPRSAKRNVLYTITSNDSNINSSVFKLETKLSGFIISFGGYRFECDYVYTVNSKYNLLLTLNSEGLLLNINGEQISKFDLAAVVKAFVLIPSGDYYHILGHEILTNSTSTPNVGLDGYMTNIISSTEGMYQHREHKDYTTNNYNKLLDFNFSNKGVVNNIIYSNFDVVNKLNVNVNYTKSGSDFKIDAIDPININGSTYDINYTINLDKSFDNALLFKNGEYEIRVSLETVPPPVDIYSDYLTTSLDFENGLIDKIETTTWKTVGTAALTTNKIFDEYSFETKSLTDVLYTESRVITGGSTPYTIEFYALLIDQAGYADANIRLLPLYSKNNNAGSGDQFLSVNMVIGNKLHYERQLYGGGVINDTTSNVGSKNIGLNEIHKYTIAYDGNAIRIFIDDKLDMVLCTDNGFIWNNSEPFKFLYSVVPSYSQYQIQTKGIIDNIKIYDGVATKVRNADPYEEYLSVDLSFDANKYQTKLIDNGKSKANWIVTGTYTNTTELVFLKNNNVFQSGYSYLKKEPTESNVLLKSTNADLNLGLDDWTLSFEFIKLVDTLYCTLIGSAVNNPSEQKDILWYFSVMGSQYTSIPLLANKLSFFNEGDLGYKLENKLLTGLDYNENILISKTTIELNKPYKVDVVSNGGYLYLFINNKLDNKAKYTKPINLSPEGVGTVIGGLSYYYAAGLWGYINYFKAYKGVSIFPKDTIGIIELDFNNNLQDKNRNSVWETSTATYDQANSVDGYAAFFNGETTISTNSPNLNFGNGNFSMEYDINLSDVSSGSRYSLTNNVYYGDISAIWMVASNHLGFDYSNRPTNPSTTNLDNIVANTYYNRKIIRKNSNLFLKYNDVLMCVHNLTNQTFNFVAGDKMCLGRADSFGIGTSMVGYIDNFKSIKDDIAVDMNVDNSEGDEGIWIQAVAAYDSTTSGKYDFTNTSATTYNDYYKNTIGFGALIYSATIGSNGYVEARKGSEPIIINRSVLNKQFKVSASNGCYDGSDILVTIEILNSNNNVIAALKWVRELTYSHYIYYGTNLSSLTRAPIIGSYPASYGDLYFKEDKIEYVSDPTRTNNVNGSFVFNVDLSDAKSIRVSNLYATENYSSCSSAFILEKVSKKVYLSHVNFEIDRPAVHLPLQSNTSNLGFTPLVVNSVGNPSYAEIESKKCIKFENGKYLTINSNNIFNLGANSDFYIEFDFYAIALATENFLLSNSNSGFHSTNTFFIEILNNKISIQKGSDGYSSDVTIDEGKFYNLKFYRKNNKIEFLLNGTKLNFNFTNLNINLDYGVTSLGVCLWYPPAAFNGYMSNFKMFVGTSVQPELYDGRKILDLDFNPTGKSYLFKDNNNKCVIHPANIKKRDFKDGQYCCTFNGVDQYLQLGKNDLLNFGNDDFIINIKFKINEKPTQNVLLLNNNADTTYNRAYIAVNGLDNSSPFKLEFGITNASSQVVYYQIRSNNDMQPNVIYDFKIISSNGNISMILNDEIQTMTLNNINNVNFNYGDNTYISKSFGTDLFFNGTIYSVKILRNTSDLALLEEAPVETSSTVNYKFTNTSTMDEVLITDDVTTANFNINRTESNVHLTINEHIASLSANPVSSNQVTLFDEYDGLIGDHLTVYDVKPDDQFTYNIPSISQESLELEELSAYDDIEEYQVYDAGDYIIDGFTEGYPNAKYRIINKHNNIVLTSGVDRFYFDGINPLYIDDYVVSLYELGITYPIPKQKMKLGSLTYYMSAVNQCKDSNYCVRLVRRRDGYFIGEYDFTGDYCDIKNLDCNTAYDAILFDRSDRYESISMSNRIPKSVE